MTVRHVLLVACLLTPFACSHSDSPRPAPSAATPKPAQSPAPAPAVTPAAPDPFLADDSPATLAAARKLEAPAPTFAVVTANKCLSALRDAGGVNISVNWKALEAAAVDQNTETSLDLQNATVRRTLTVLLRQLAPVSTPLGYLINDGTVVISTQDDLDARFQSTRIYDVRDLLLANSRLAESSPPGFFRQGAGGATGGMFSGESPANPEADDTREVTQLINLIANTVEPTSWKTIDDQPGTGTIGSIVASHGRFVVRQTPRAHFAIAQFIDTLRQSTLVSNNIDVLIIAIPKPIEDYLPALPGEKNPSDFLDPAAVSRLRAAIAADPRASILAAPHITLLNYQSAYLSTETRNAYVQSVDPATGTPYMDFYSTGSAIVVAAARIPQTDSFVVRLRPSGSLADVLPQPLTVPGQPTTAPVAAPTSGSASGLSGGVSGSGMIPNAAPTLTAITHDFRLILPAHKYAILGGLSRTTDPKSPAQSFIYTLVSAHPVKP